MKRKQAGSPAIDVEDDLRDEYRFDYSKARPNRFAGLSGELRVTVVLDPDVAEVFQTPDAVNEILRALIKAMPKRPPVKAKTRSVRKPD